MGGQNGNQLSLPIRVLCMDAQEVVLLGLQNRLQLEPDLLVVGLLKSPDRLMLAVDQEQPDVVLLDIESERADLLGMITRIVRQRPKTRCVVYTNRLRPGCVHAALSSGATGYVAKQDAVEELIRVVRAAPSACTELLSTSVRAALASGGAEDNSGDRRAALTQLTPREVQILCLLGRGMTRNDIAETIRRSPKTVDAHRASIMNKLGFKNRVELARFAIREGIIEA
ncbi:MAG: response regulator transcription factor [Phycisphaerales bacterium]